MKRMHFERLPILCASTHHTFVNVLQTILKRSLQVLVPTLLLSAASAQLPYQNPQLSAASRARDLISRLTLQEKALLLQDQSPAITRLGIKKFNWWSEALHGLANNDSVTVFPEPIGMAASFDDALVYKIFDAVSDETRAKYNQAMQRGQENKRFLSLSVWTPNINIFRDPRWGRGQETYGEDPFLTSRMGVSVVKGLQGPADAKYRKLLACAKHFAVHSGPEWSRHQLNLNNVAPRDLWETYLPAFKALVTKADVRQVMCAYQRLDDEPCCGNNHLLQTILRDQWGFKHVIVSDCGAVTDFFTSHKVSSDAVHASAKAANAGTDVECVWAGYAYANLPEAVKKGLVSERNINEHLQRVLTARIELGEIDKDVLVPWTKIPASVINNTEHRELALQMAREAMTLLQNKNNVLPLGKSVQKLAVIGPNADNGPMLWGNYNGTPIRTITILNGIQSKLGANSVVYDKACDLVEDKVTQSYFSHTSSGGKKGFAATYWNNQDRTGNPVTTGQIVNPLKLTTAGDHEFASGVKLVGFSARYETDFVAPETEEIVFKLGATGHFELFVNGTSLTRFNNWRTLPTRVPYKVEKGKTYHIEIQYAQLNNWQANLEFDFGKEFDIDFSGLVQKLKDVEVVIFAGGLSTLLEGEEMPVSYPGFKGGDRTDIQLPEVQRKCLKALKAAGKKVVFVNCSGSAIGLVPETESCEAILQAWYGGESGGQAVADVLFGDYNPSGKLPITFYKDTTQLPGFEDYSMKGRTYRYLTSAPLFSFGHGLSYTTFNIGEAQATKTALRNGESLRLTIPVSNTGKREGTEVVQVYLRKANDSSGLNKTLRGFQRLQVAPGKMVPAIVDLPYNAFEFFDEAGGTLKVTPGDYQVWYGNSSAEKDLKMITVKLL
jgi:beta-glucosidase